MTPYETPYEYFRRCLANLDELYLDKLERFGAGHPATEFIAYCRDGCEIQLQQMRYIP